MMIRAFIFLFISIYLQAQSYNGIVEPIKKVNLSLSIDGILKKIYVKEGENVKKENIILSIDSKIQELEVKQKKVLLKNNKNIFYLKKEIAVVNDMYKMSKSLYKKTGSISKNELNNYELKYYNLKNDFESLLNNKKIEKIQYQLANEKLKLYNLKAPFDGIITKISLDIGEWCTRGEAIVELVDSTVCFVETNIKVSDIESVKLNKKYIITIKSDNSIVKKEGKVTYISPVVDSSSGLVLIKIEFDNKALEIRPGVLATIEIKKQI